MVSGVEPKLCATYEAYFGAGTKLTVLGKFGHLVGIIDLQKRVQSNKESEKPKLKLCLWVLSKEVDSFRYEMRPTG